jgi:hypothetical protein
MADILNHRGGFDRNNLLNIIKDLDNYEEMLTICAESPYIDTENLSSYMQKFKNHFTVLDINIQSLNAKFDCFITLLNDLFNANIYFSAICIQETWLKHFTNLDLFSIPNYSMFSLPPTCSSHGGLVIYVHENFNANKLDIYKTSELWEGLFLEISGGGLSKPLNLCNIYRPPRDTNSDIEKVLSEFTPIVSNMTNSQRECVIAGDFNLDLLKIESRISYSKYLELMYSFSLVPSVTLPTRLSRRRATLIDHIFYKSSSTRLTGGIVLSNISDHLIPFVCLDIKTQYVSPPKTVSFQPSDIDSTNAFISAVNNIDFVDIISTNGNIDANSSFNIFKENIDRCIETHLPFQTVKFHRYKHKIRPWITSGILVSLKKRDGMYRQLKKLNPNSEKYNTLNINLHTYNNILKKLQRNSKFSYYNEMFSKCKNDARKSWKLINTLIGNTRSKNNICNIFTINGSQTSNQAEIAEHFNTFFSNIGRQQAENIPCFPNNNFKKYLNNPVTNEFVFTPVNEIEITKIITELKPKNSAGDDNLSLNLLKRLKHKISLPLSILINKSLSEGIFPDALKLAKVIPLFKKDDPSYFNNYRPISLLLSVSKIYEKIVHKQLLSYFTNNKLLYAHQYGFRPLHSTEAASLELIDRIFSLLDEDKIPFAIFMDLSKAFDTLNHNILLYKLSYYGIKNISYSWFQSYLSDRKQYVNYNNTKSSISTLSLGVPQGSILGPLLFLIYVNDVSHVSSLFRCILYADDTTLTSTFCSFNDSESPENLMNTEINKIYKWLCANKLSLNIAKTKYMIFHSPNKSLQNINTPVLAINNLPIECVDKFDFLGITLTSTLSWKAHQSKICKKLSRTIGILQRLRNMVPSNILLNIYNSLFVSHISNSVLVWGHKADRIFKLQKRAIVFKKRYNDHTSPLFKQNNLLKFEDIYKTAAAKFYFKYINDKLPKYFNNMFDTIPFTHHYNTRQTNPRVQISRKKFTSQCIRFFLPKIIDELPTQVTNKLSTHSLSGFSTHSLSGFGSYTKSYFINQYSNICTINNCYVCGTETDS